jgi:hypothetical protein
MAEDLIGILAIFGELRCHGSVTGCHGPAALGDLISRMAVHRSSAKNIFIKL